MAHTIKFSRTAAAVGLIFVMAFAAYWNSLRGNFIWDDTTLIVNNSLIKDWRHLPDLFVQDVGAGSGHSFGYYRPMQVLTYMLNYSLWKLHPAGFHLTNIVLHSLVGICVFLFVRLLFADYLLALLTSLLFTAHPVHTEVVAFISGTPDALSALFILATIILYIKNLRLRSLSLYLAMVATYVVAFFCKENALALPLLLLVFHAAFKEKIQWRPFLSLCLILLLYTVFRATRETTLGYYVPHGYFFPIMAKRVPGFFIALTEYVRLLFVPVSQRTEYGNDFYHFTDPRALAGMLILATLLTIAVKNRVRNRLVFFSIGWFLVALSPTTSIYPMAAFFMSEHWLYLPSLGFFLLAAYGITCAWRIPRFRMLAKVVAGVLVVLYSLLTMHMNTFWCDAGKFYERNLKFYPLSARIYNNLANYYMQEGQNEKAVAAFTRSMELDPKSVDASYNLGNLYAQKGDLKKALEYYLKTIAGDPRYASACTNAGNVYASLGDLVKAKELYLRAIAINPFLKEAYYNLGMVYNDTKMYPEAIDAYKKALAIDPRYLDAYFQLGIVYSAVGRFADTVALYKQALQVEPGNPGAYFNLGVAFFYNKQFDLAAEYCQKARAMGFPVDPHFLQALESHSR